MTTNPPHGPAPDGTDPSRPPGATPIDSTAPTDQSSSDKTLRRLLLGLGVFLVVAAAGLIVLLVYLLQPEGEVESLALPDDCPMNSADGVYGYGSDLDELLRQPLAVAFDGEGDLWISDTGNSRIVHLRPDGELRGIVGTDDGDGRVVSPYGLSFDESFDRLYVADWTAGFVFVFSVDGRFIERYPAADQDPDVFGENGFTPFHVEVSGAQILVSSNDGLYFFDRAGHVTDSWKDLGESAGELAFPDAFDIDRETGDIYIADTLNRRVIGLNSSGEVLWISGSADESGETTGFWQLPRSVTVGSDGLLYVVDTFRAQEKCSGVGHIVVLDKSGSLVSEFGAAGGQEWAFDFPEKLDVGTDGLFAIADREKGRAVLFELGELPPADLFELQEYEQSFQRYDN